jgi:DNA polymerase-1
MFAEAPCRSREAALAALKPLLESDAVLKVGQNIKYDLTVLARHGIAVAPIDDTMVMSFCLDAGRGEDRRGGHGMDELASRHLSHTTILFKDVCGTGKKQISFAKCRWPMPRAMPPRTPK